MTFLLLLLAVGGLNRSNRTVQVFEHTHAMPDKCFTPWHFHCTESNDCTATHREQRTRTIHFKNGDSKEIRDCVVDHVWPLECGGVDAVENMQWQTHAESVAKDKRERHCELTKDECKRGKHGAGAKASCR